MATYARKLKDGNGSYICPVTRSDLVYFPDNTVLSKLTFYPVGSIYQSTNSESPASLFGGEWEVIEGRFLLGSNSSYETESTGGEESHVLTINEMPIHDHATKTPGWRYVLWDTPGGESFSCGGSGNPVSYSWDPQRINSRGGDQPHNNMPPYYTVNIWRRVA